MCANSWWFGNPCSDWSASSVSFGYLHGQLMCFLLAKPPGVAECYILTCQGITLIGLKDYNAFWSWHLDGGVGSMDDRHKHEERPPQDTVVSDVKANHFKCQHLLALVFSCLAGHLQVDAPDGVDDYPRMIPWKVPCTEVKSAKLRPISMKVFFIIKLSEAPLSIRVLATLWHPI
jgi:hypothetical protein